MKKILFIDRDGTLVIEPPTDYQLDAFEKLEFYPKVFRNLHFIRQKLDFELVMVTNQDGLGTDSFPENTFWPVHNLIMKTFENEGITFDDVQIDRSFPEDNAPTRKPRTGMLTQYIDNPAYDLAGSFVIGDRATDVELARNLGWRTDGRNQADYKRNGHPYPYELGRERHLRHPHGIGLLRPHAGTDWQAQWNRPDRLCQR